jgi:hypothetical protein
MALTEAFALTIAASQRLTAAQGHSARPVPKGSAEKQTVKIARSHVGKQNSRKTNTFGFLHHF